MRPTKFGQPPHPAVSIPKTVSDISLIRVYKNGEATSKNKRPTIMETIHLSFEVYDLS